MLLPLLREYDTWRVDVPVTDVLRTYAYEDSSEYTYIYGVGIHNIIILSMIPGEYHR